MSTKSPISKLTVLGAGLMGHGIAQVFMGDDMQVSVWDPNPEALESVPERIAAHLELMGSDAKFSVDLVADLASAVRGSEVVIEAAPEELRIKRDLVAQVYSVNAECIFATNTSVLRITEIAEGAKSPELIVGMHWWNPPYLMPLVEVVRGERTSDDTVARSIELLTAFDKVPVEVHKDVPGFVGNRMQFALMREAAYIVEQGICSAETVDRVASLTFGRRLAAVGPLRNADFIGLDLVRSILDYLSPSLSRATTTPELFTDALSAGATGAKSGRGIYDWGSGERESVEARLLAHLVSLRDE